MPLSPEQMEARREMIARLAKKKVIDTTKDRPEDDRDGPRAVDRVIESRRDGKNLFR